MPRIDRLEARCAELGWQLDFLFPGWLTEELLPRMAKLKVDFTMAHMGMFLAKDGRNQPGFQSLIDLLKVEPRLRQADRRVPHVDRRRASPTRSRWRRR